MALSELNKNLLGDTGRCLSLGVKGWQLWSLDILSRLTFLWLYDRGQRALSHWHQHCLFKRTVSCLTTQDWEITKGKYKLQLCTSAKWPHFKVSFRCCYSRGSCHYLQEEYPLSQNCSCFSLQTLRISRCTLHPETLGTQCGLDNQDRHALGACPHTHCWGHCCSPESWGQDETWRDTGNTTKTCQLHHVGNHTKICRRLMESAPGLSKEKLSLCLNHAPWFRLGWHFWGVLGRRVIHWGPVIPADLSCPAVCWAQ